MSGTTQSTSQGYTPKPVDGETAGQMLDAEYADSEIVTKTNILLSELPLSQDDIKAMISNLAETIRQEKTIKSIAVQ